MYQPFDRLLVSWYLVVVLTASRIDHRCDSESDSYVRRYYLEYQFGSFVLLCVIVYCNIRYLYDSGLFCEPYVETDQSP